MSQFRIEPKAHARGDTRPSGEVLVRARRIYKVDRGRRRKDGVGL